MPKFVLEKVAVAPPATHNYRLTVDDTLYASVPNQAELRRLLRRHGVLSPTANWLAKKTFEAGKFMWDDRYV